MIQLKYSIPDKLLFPNNYSYLSGNSKEKINNFASILAKIKKTSKKKNPQILDIGSNDGSFLEIVKKKYPKVLGVEPTNTARNAIKKGINTIKKSLNFKLAKKILNKYSKFDFIIASNFFAQTNNLKEILDVDHIDVFYVAPGDLAQSIGLLGQANHPEVLKTVDQAISQIQASGRVAGTLVNDGNVESYLEKGVKFVTTSIAPWLEKGAKDFLVRCNK